LFYKTASNLTPFSAIGNFKWPWKYISSSHPPKDQWPQKS